MNRLFKKDPYFRKNRILQCHFGRGDSALQVNGENYGVYGKDALSKSEARFLVEKTPRTFSLTQFLFNLRLLLSLFLSSHCHNARMPRADPLFLEIQKSDRLNLPETQTIVLHKHGQNILG